MTNNKTLTELEQAAANEYFKWDNLNPQIKDIPAIHLDGVLTGYNYAIHSQNLVKMEDVVKVIEKEITILSERKHVYQYTIHILNILLRQLKNLK